MPMLLVKCPATGNDDNLSPAPVRCPYCEKDHTWYKSDLFFKPATKAAS